MTYTTCEMHMNTQNTRKQWVLRSTASPAMHPWTKLQDELQTPLKTSNYFNWVKIILKLSITSHQVKDKQLHFFPSRVLLLHLTFLSFFPSRQTFSMKSKIWPLLSSHTAKSLIQALLISHCNHCNLLSFSLHKCISSWILLQRSFPKSIHFKPLSLQPFNPPFLSHQI